MNSGSSAFISARAGNRRGLLCSSAMPEVAPSTHRLAAGALDDDQPRLHAWHFERLVGVGLERHLRPPRRPFVGGDDELGRQPLMRSARLSGEKPPKTMEWTAPMRAQASMA